MNVSVIIPSRNEFLLKKTIDTTLAASKGDIEVIAVCDGYWPEPFIPDDPRVVLIHHSEPVGQRHAINEAALIAKGKFILKTDGHSTFAKGFDVKLAENCEYDWTVIPRMYNLHAFDWLCKNGHRFYQDKANPHKENKCPECKELLEIEYIWKPRLHKKTDFMYMDKDLRVQYWNSYRKRPEAKGDIVDVMNGQGACWFQNRERFLELGGLDEKHGFWGQVGIEVACKAWLSGGRQVVNKKTWFAHMFRTTGPFGFPYKIRGSDQEKARRYSRDLWLNNKWPHQKRDFQWLIDKFSPVPSWNGEKSYPRTNGDYETVAMSVEDVYENRHTFCEKGKTEKFLRRYTKSHPNMDEELRLKASPKKSIENFFKSFRPFVRMVLDNKEFKIEDTDYFKYLLTHLNPHDLLPKLTRKGKRRAIHKAKDAINLIRDIRENGMKDPVDMWLDNEVRIMRKGYRRLVILKELGVFQMAVRIWKDEETFYKNQTGRIPKKWRKKLGR